jgi:hypothetical protein
MKALIIAATLLIGVGCGAPRQAEPFECPPDDSVPRYSELTAIPTCIACHSSSLTGAARNGAPAPINYDTAEGAGRASLVGLSAMERGAMPPGGPPDQSEIDQWKVWAECGKPE